jgi:AraC-like DNA-binding protein
MLACRISLQHLRRCCSTLFVFIQDVVIIDFHDYLVHDNANHQDRFNPVWIMNEVFKTIYLLAALQGVLLSAFLFTKKQNHTANLVLAVATLALSIELATVVYYANGWYTLYPRLMSFSYPFPALYGPLFFLYAQLISKKKERLRAIDLIHFTPVLVVYCITAPVFFSSSEALIAFLNAMILGIHDPIYTIFEGFVPVQGIIYTLFTIKTVAEYDRSIKDSYSNIDLINLTWLKYLNLGGAFIWSIVAVGLVAHIFGLYFAQSNALLNIPLAILIYSIGYMGLKQPEIFLDPASISLHTEKREKYQRSGLSDESAEDIKIRLLALMSAEKPFLGQDLTLQKLAERLKTSSHNLSEVINTTMHQSYYDFINQYRVEEFKNRLADPESERYNLLSIALDSGFNSKGTFNSIFKKFTGMTPSEYKATLNSP